MKSNKQRRAEIKAHRLGRAARSEAQMRAPDQRRDLILRATGMEPADLGVLGLYNNTYGPLPGHYLDRAFSCRDCGAEEVWTARQQKWWYEIVHGSIESRAVRCLACRRARRAGLAPSRKGEGANRLGEMSERLRGLAGSAPTEASRAEADAALESKWWSLRVLAIAALGRWGTAADIARLCAFVDAPRSRWDLWRIEGAGAAVKALAGCLRHPEDDGWAIEVCLRGHGGPWSWREFLSAIPADRIAAFAKEEFARRDGDADRLLRLLALMHCIGRAPSPTQMGIVRTHACKDVRLWTRHFPPEVA